MGLSVKGCSRCRDVGEGVCYQARKERVSGSGGCNEWMVPIIDSNI